MCLGGALRWGGEGAGEHSHDPVGAHCGVQRHHQEEAAQRCNAHPQGQAIHGDHYRLLHDASQVQPPPIALPLEIKTQIDQTFCCSTTVEYLLCVVFNARRPWWANLMQCAILQLRE